MSEKDDFSIEDSEELINHLKKGDTSQLPHLQSTLRLLARVPELSHSSVPPILPSEIGQSVRQISKTSKSHRTIITSILAAGILTSASLAAAAVTGRGPAPIVAAAHESAKLIGAVAGAVSKVLTGNNSDSPQDEPDDSTPSIGKPSTSPEENNETQKSDEQNSGSDDESKGLTPIASLYPVPNESSPENKSDEKKKSSDEKSKSEDSNANGKQTTTDQITPSPSPKPSFIVAPDITKPSSSEDDGVEEDD